jgi:hypothetical protein
VSFFPGPAFPVTAVHLHPTADIAILETPEDRSLHGIVLFAGIRPAFSLVRITVPSASLKSSSLGTQAAAGID